MNTYFNADCPCFPGFYESFLYSPDFEREQRELAIATEYSTRNFAPVLLDNYLEKCPEAIGLQFDFDDYCKDAARRFCEIAGDYMCLALQVPGLPFSHIGSVRFDFVRIRSPREYNFTTDAVECKAVISEDGISLLKGYLENNSREWDIYKLEHFSDRSGFYSFYSPSDEGFDNPEFWGKDSVYISAVLDFVLRDYMGDDPEFTISCEVLEKVAPAGYMYVPEALKDFVNSPGVDYYEKEVARLDYQKWEYLRIMGNGYVKAVSEGYIAALDDLTEEMIAAVMNIKKGA